MSQVDEIYKKKRWPKHIAKDKAASDAPPLYGEISQKGVDIVIGKFHEIFSDPTGVFYDLGSGTGKMVTHISVSCPISRAIGVEYYQDRLDVAVEQAKKYKYKSAFPPEFIKANIFNMDYTGATIIYIDCTHIGFQKEVEKRMASKIPKGCLLIYRGRDLWPDLGEDRGEFVAPTTYDEEKTAKWTMF